MAGAWEINRFGLVLGNGDRAQTQVVERPVNRPMNRLINTSISTPISTSISSDRESSVGNA
ncbi:MAG: hypothetical protein EA001_04175 [Oscillatoriales cyanobacterium]|nr:MAG: hypothetical protein EA001_04175 [Oscillatoriales cyanobacterium]